MKILLDTHYLIWILQGENISRELEKMVLDPDNSIYFSIISIWEIAIKKYSSPDKFSFSAEDVFRYAEQAGFEMLKLSVDHIFKIETLKIKVGKKEHKDPFDRLLIAQAKNEKMRFLTKDQRIADYDEKCVLVI